MMQEGITFSAQLQGIRTTADGGWRITFDMPDSERENVVQLSQLRDTLLQLAVVPIKEDMNAGWETENRD